MSVTTREVLLAPKSRPAHWAKDLSVVLGVIFIALSDLAVLCFSLYLAFLSRAYFLPAFNHSFAGHLSYNTVLNLWWMPVLCILTMANEGLYHKRYPYWQEVKLITKGLTLSLVIGSLFMFILKTGTFSSRPVVILAYTYSLLLVPVSRRLVKQLIIGRGFWQKPVIILGAGKTAELVLKGLCHERVMGYQPVGLLEDDPDKQGGIAAAQYFVPVVGKFCDVEAIINKTGIKDIIIAAPGLKNSQLVKLTSKLQQLSANLMLVPDLFGIPLAGIEISCLFNEQTMLLSVPNNLASPWGRFIKRFFDLAVGSIILFVCLPAMLLIAIMIKLDSKGPVLFKHSRIGKNGERFYCLKFRSMVVNSQQVLNDLLRENPAIREEWEREFKIKNDPRITRVGKFLRRTSLDELPQLINVLAGQMSLVGPRPIIEDEIKKYGACFHEFKMVPPGLTGLWQVSGRSDIDYGERIQLDTWYVRNWSLWLDVTILFRTVGVVLGAKGAY